MCPIAILDKSSFQCISSNEMLYFHKHFIHNLTPILAFELLADLSKGFKKGKTPENAVAGLMKKFQGSGPPINVDYRKACYNSLYGQQILMDGRVVVDYARVKTNQDGTYGAIIDLHPINKAIMRWRQGDFTLTEKELTAQFRDTTRSFSYSSFRGQLDRLKIIVPHADTKEELAEIVTNLAITAGLQDTWFKWLLSQMYLPLLSNKALSERWQMRSTFLLRDYAPFAFHCLKVLLSLHAAVRSGLLKWDSTHLIDIQYLFYLPFCWVFVSDDKLHETLFPALKRSDQRFLKGRELKADLKRQAEFWSSLMPEHSSRLASALGQYPIPMKNSILNDLYRQYCKPWRPGMGSYSFKKDDLERERGVQEVIALIENAEKRD